MENLPENNDSAFEILRDVKVLARRYRALTGKPLGITGEVAEYEAARILNLDLAIARQAGYDAVEIRDCLPHKLQIKGRCILTSSIAGQRIGSIDINKEFDAVLLVLLNQNYDATIIYEASKDDVLDLLSRPGSIARNVRGALNVAQFKSVAHVRWQK